MRGSKLRFILLAIAWSGGCATVRTTDTPRTATEQYLVNQASVRAVEQLNLPAVRDRSVFVDATYLSGSSPPSQDQAFLIGEVRARLLQIGARIISERDKADLIVEIRAQAIGTDNYEYLLGIPAGSVGLLNANVSTITPELAIVKSTRLEGYVTVSLVAIWRDTGELAGISGPMLGRSTRTDYWFFGAGPETGGDITPAQQR
jgi:hypothetical protein